MSCEPKSEGSILNVVVMDQVYQKETKKKKKKNTKQGETR